MASRRNITVQHSARNGQTIQKLWGTITFVLGFVFGICLAGSLIFSDNRLLLMAAATVPALILSAFNSLDRDTDLFAPLNFVFVTVFIGVLLQSFYLCYLDNRTHPFAIGVMTDVDSLILACAAISIAMISLVSGYAVGGALIKNRRGRRKASDPKRRWSDRKLNIVCGALIFISIASLLYYIAFFDVMDNIQQRFSVKRRVIDESSGVYRTLGYVRLGVSLSQIAFFLLFARYLSKSPGERKKSTVLLLWVLATISIAMPFLASSRLGIITFLVGVGAIHHFSTGGWPVRRLGTLVVVVCVIVIGMGSMRFAQSRNMSYSDYRSEVSIVSTISPVLAASNFLGVGKTAVILETVPRLLGYQYGGTYLTWVVGPIPRSIWKNKPVMRIGGILGYAIFGTSQATGIPPGGVGELYLNFGWIGLPLGMVLFGVFFRWFYIRVLLPSYIDREMRVIFASVVMFVSFTGLSADFSGMMSMALQRLLPILAVFWLIRVSPRAVGSARPG